MILCISWGSKERVKEKRGWYLSKLVRTWPFAVSIISFITFWSGEKYACPQSKMLQMRERGYEGNLLAFQIVPCTLHPISCLIRSIHPGMKGESFSEQKERTGQKRKARVDIFCKWWRKLVTSRKSATFPVSNWPRMIGRSLWHEKTLLWSNSKTT